VFHLYHHHDLERLAELLAVLLQRDHPASPLVPARVIVANHGVGRWLQAQLAASDGVAANIDFALPARFIWTDLLAELGETGGGADYFRERLRWHLYRLLPEIAREEPAVARYLAAQPAEIQRLQLAERLADVFDQYQVFRGDLLETWDRGGARGAGRTERWQSRVWRRLAAALGPDHRAALLRRMIRQLQDDAPPGGGRLFCFGIASLPPDYLRLLYALGRTRDVHLLLPNPSDGYWADLAGQRLPLGFARDAEPLPGEAAIEAGHPLLAALGRPVRDFIHLLYAQEMTAIQEPELGDALQYEPPGDGCLLHRVQGGIIRLDAAPESRGPCPDDLSVQVHSCHGPLREVQVLHDQLLDLLGRERTLEPRDIVVMTPDPAAYAPAVRSVFGAAQGRRHIPWSVSGQPRWASHPIVQTFRQLLDLPLSRWTASEVMAVAAVPAVMRRFGFDPAGLDTLQLWVRESGIRWGLDAGTRSRLGAGRYDQNSWRFGLDRLLLGSVMNDEETLLDDVAPWSDLEGGGAEMLGRLWRLLGELESWQQALERDRPAAGWRREFNALLSRLFEPDADDRAEREALEAIQDALEVLQTAGECLEEQPLSWLALREALGAELDRPGGRQPFLSGGVTFSDLETLAGVPFRVVCLLGMNDGAFPRQDGGREFNLMQHRRLLGDRSNRDADRQFFLQALMAARDVFYVSYTGRDVRSGEALEPATTVAEFLDFLHRHHCRDWTPEQFAARVVTQQPMQPFSRRYFEPGRPPRVFTFAAGWHPGADAGSAPRVPMPGLLDGSAAEAGAPAVIELDALRRFYRNPPRVFLQERLGLYLDDTGTFPEDSERFALDNREAWDLRNRLLQDAGGGRDPGDEPSRLWQRRGLLPPPPLDRAAWRTEADAVRSLLPVRERWHREPPTALDIDLALPDGWRLAGRLSDLCPGGLYRLRPGSLSPRSTLGDWIDCLALAASGHCATLHLAGLDDGKLTLREARVSVDEARAALERLVQWFLEGQLRPLPFLPDLAEIYLDERDRRLGRGAAPEEAAAAALETVNGKLDPQSRYAHHALQDPYFVAVLERGAPLGARPGDSVFCALSEDACGLLHERLLPAVGEASTGV
jgi:exodeoxyribonuclease V gamma subunit